MCKTHGIYSQNAGMPISWVLEFAGSSGKIRQNIVLGVAEQALINAHICFHRNNFYLHTIVTSNLPWHMIAVLTHWQIAIDPSKKSSNTLNKYPNVPVCNKNVHTCAHLYLTMVHCGIWVGCIMGYGTGTLCDLCVRSIVNAPSWRLFETNGFVSELLQRDNTPNGIIVAFRISKRKLLPYQTSRHYLRRHM